MDKNIFEYMINLTVVIPFILILLILSIKLSKGKFDKVYEGKYAQVIERSNLTKDTNMFVLKTGNKGCVVVVSPSNTEKIKDLSQEEVEELLNKRKVKNLDLNKEIIKNLNLNLVSKKSRNKDIKLWKL